MIEQADIGNELAFIIFKAEDGIRDPVWSRGLGDVYERQDFALPKAENIPQEAARGTAWRRDRE